MEFKKKYFLKSVILHIILIKYIYTYIKNSLIYVYIYIEYLMKLLIKLKFQVYYTPRVAGNLSWEDSALSKAARQTM